MFGGVGRGAYMSRAVCVRSPWLTVLFSFLLATANPRADAFSPWYLHPTRHIEVWGVKNKRPVLTYRVRESKVMNVQVHSPSVGCVCVVVAVCFAFAFMWGVSCLRGGEHLTDD